MSLKCIIIDDSLFIRQAVKAIIEEAGHEVIAMFENGPSFLNNISNYDPDVIFCDIILPEMTGLDLLELIREGFPNVKIIMLSGVTQSDAISAALRLGAIDFIQKPVDKDRLHLLLDKLSSTSVVPSVEELSVIGVACAILSGFFEEIVAHSSSTLKQVIKSQINSIISDILETKPGMFSFDPEKMVVELDPALWGVYSEDDVLDTIKQIPEDLKFELEFLYTPDFIENLYNQAIQTMGSKKRMLQLFEKVSPNSIGLPEVPQIEDNLTLASKAGTTYEELDNSISVALFKFDIAGPSIQSKINLDLLTEGDLMKNSIFYYTLIDEESFQEGLFGPLPVSSEKRNNLSSLAYAFKKYDEQGECWIMVLSVFYTPIAERLNSDYNRLSFIIRTRLAAVQYLEDIDKTVLRGLVDDIIDYLLSN